MALYQYDVSVSKQKKFKRRFKKLFLILLAILLVVGIIILIDSLKTKDENQQGKIESHTVSEDFAEFTTPFFYFKTAKSWRTVEKESTDNKFVYRSFRGTLLEQELVVYVNNPGADLIATHVLPVEIESKQSIISTNVSDHCNTVSAVKKAGASTPITIAGVAMQCVLDGTEYKVAAGVKGGTTDIVLTRPGGTTATYNFLYKNFTFSPDGLAFIKLLRTFKTL